MLSPSHEFTHLYALFLHLWLNTSERKCVQVKVGKYKWVCSSEVERMKVNVRAYVQMNVSACKWRLVNTSECAQVKFSACKWMWILRRIFRSSRVFRPPKHTHLEWNLLGFMELLFLFAIRDFSCWGESDLWSDVWPRSFWTAPRIATSGQVVNTIDWDQNQ